MAASEATTASKHPQIKYGLRFEISDPNYLLIHMHIAYMEWALFAASEAITASKQPQRSNLTSDLKSVKPKTYLSMCILLIWYGPFLAASEATTASKQPQMSNLTSDLKSVTPITYLSMCILFIWYGLSWQPLRPLWPPNSLRGKI